MNKTVLWSIRKPHTDNIKNGNKWDEIRKRIPKDLSILTRNFIYETKANGGCGKVIGEFRVSSKTYIYADIDNDGTKHLYNTAFIMPAISDEDLFNYLYDSKGNSGWALRISRLKIYDKPKELGEFFTKGECQREFCAGCKNFHKGDGWLDGSYCDEDGCIEWGLKPLTRPPQSWCYVEEL